MDNQNKNLLLATGLSLVVIVVWSYFFQPPPQAIQSPTETAQTEAGSPPGDTTAAPSVPSGATPGQQPADNVVATAPRVAIDTPSLEGSISLAGGRIDVLGLKQYKTSIEPQADDVSLLRPATEDHSYFALFGWLPGNGLEFSDVPADDAIWQVEGNQTLSPGNDVTLVWQSPKGLTFRNRVSVDDKFMFTVTQTVENGTDAPVRAAPFGRISRYGLPEALTGVWVVHEGAIHQNDDGREYVTYKDMRDLSDTGDWSYGSNLSKAVEVTGNRWIGITDHYWMTTLAPVTEGTFTSVLQYNTATDVYSTWARMTPIDVAPGETASSTMRLFAGAKEWETIRDYQNDLDIVNFEDSIDWGALFFLTKPIFRALHFLYGVIGNMGWSIIALTLLIKALLFPLAYKSYVSMARMKELQPEMEKIKERAAGDSQKMQREMMTLYKEKKVNPAAGCLPILPQIPIFFSLYKVIFVTLEMRQAPWFGWIKDLSAPDPSSLFNLWGLFPWAPPEHGTILALIFIGILPLLLGVSMFLQQKLNPAPTDPTQAMIFAWMPWVFMFMLGRFASGLVLYWIANNTITFTQQYIIMRSQGYKPDVFGNILSGFKRRSKGADAPPPKK